MASIKGDIAYPAFPRTVSLVFGQTVLQELAPETFKPPKRYSLPDTTHRVKVKVQIMQRVKGGRADFVDRKKMP
jgi:hypothetical protein